MPTYTNPNLPSVDSTDIVGFIQAQFPNAELDVFFDDKVRSITMPDLQQAEFDALIASLKANFPRMFDPNDLYLTPFMLVPTGAAIPWIMPAAPAEFLGLTLHRTGANLSAVRKCRILANVQIPGLAGARLGIQWASADAGPWAFLNAAGNGPNVLVDAAGMRKGAEFAIDNAARQDAILRLVGVGGNGIAQATFGAICLQAIR